MLFQIPPCLTLDERILFQHRMMYDDPDHRRLTAEFLGKNPIDVTDVELVQHWFETHAFERVNGILTDAIQNRQSSSQVA